MANSCFICNYERKDFEQRDKSFEYHRLTEHNLWNYVYYVIYILKKDQMEYNGIESHVRSKYDGKSTEWFPIGKTKYLTGEEEDIDALEVKIDSLIKMTEKLVADKEEKEEGEHEVEPPRPQMPPPPPLVPSGPLASIASSGQLPPLFSQRPPKSENSGLESKIDGLQNALERRMSEIEDRVQKIQYRQMVNCDEINKKLTELIEGNY